MVLASSSDTILASMVFPIADTWEGHFTDRMGRKIPLLFFIVVGYLRRNKKTSKRITRADVGIVEARFAATGGSWELSQVIEVSSSPELLSCKVWLTPWCQSINPRRTEDETPAFVSI